MENFKKTLDGRYALHAKYSMDYESISEHDMAEQASYWFYTSLLYPRRRGQQGGTQAQIDRLKGALSGDAELQEWYDGFLHEAADHYGARLHAVRNMVQSF